MRTEKNILLHELIGLRCEVIGAENKAQIGMEGRIVDETLKTVVIDGKTVPKKGTEFRIQLGKKKIDINGDFLAARPEDRIKKKVRKW